MSVVSVALGTLFLLAAAGKLTAKAPLTSYLTALGIEPGLGAVLDRTVPYFEIGLGIWLCTGVQSLLSAVLALLFSSAFAGVHILANVTGVVTSCRCFGRADTEMTAAAGLARSAGLVILASAGVAVAATARGAGSHEMPGVLVAGVLAGLSFHLAFLVGNEVIALIRRDAEMARAVAEAAKEHSKRKALHVT
jgi:uncharacterized membrane protein YphA (DoxX/SURF4 family)